MPVAVGDPHHDEEEDEEEEDEAGDDVDDRRGDRDRHGGLHLRHRATPAEKAGVNICFINVYFQVKCQTSEITRKSNAQYLGLTRSNDLKRGDKIMKKKTRLQTIGTYFWFSQGSI